MSGAVTTRARLVAPTLAGYRRSWLAPDLLAGLTLVAIAVPEQMATARLVNVPPVVGLYAFVAGSVMFVLLGRSPNLSSGADSTIAPVLAAGIAAVAVVGTPRYAHLVPVFALMVGVLVVAAGLLRLGWVSDLFSAPVITGVLAGIAVEIVVGQLPAVLGVPGGGMSTIGRLSHIRHELGHVNGWDVAIAVFVFVVIVACEHIDRRIPGALIGLVIATVVTAALGLQDHGVAVLGTIHGGLPSVGVPSASWRDVRRLIGPALTVAFLCIVQTAATVRAASKGTPTPDDFDRDLVALGAGSLASGFIGSFAVNSSPPRTEVVSSSGGRSQLAGLTAAAASLAVVLYATGLLSDIPQATLGAILVYVATRLFRVGELRAIRRFDRLEFGLALVTLCAVALYGIEVGVALAVLLSLIDRTRRSARPRDAVLGREPGTDHWIPRDIGRPTEQVPGVLVYLIYAPLWYGNANYVAEQVRELVDLSPTPVKTFVLDANGISDIDYTGARAFQQLALDLQARGVTTAIARSSHLVHHDLKHSGLLQRIPPDHLFSSVQDAIDALAGGG